MEDGKLKDIKQKLEQQMKEIKDTIGLITSNEYNDSIQEYTKELSMYDNHPADTGSETAEMQKTFALKNNQMYRLRQIEQALDRIERGDYGKCTICGKDIRPERLDVYPEADTCMECSETTRIPQHRIMEGRPVEEEVVSYPYNSRNAFNVSRTQFDGEDSWQAVARYNRREDDPSNQTSDHQGIWDEELSGYVEEVDKISNKYYKGQLPDAEREDVD